MHASECKQNIFFIRTHGFTALSVKRLILDYKEESAEVISNWLDIADGKHCHSVNKQVSPLQASSIKKKQKTST